jgi:hypothetical protein
MKAAVQQCVQQRHLTRSHTTGLHLPPEQAGMPLTRHLPFSTDQKVRSSSSLGRAYHRRPVTRENLKTGLLPDPLHFGAC